MDMIAAANKRFSAAAWNYEKQVERDIGFREGASGGMPSHCYDNSDMEDADDALVASIPFPCHFFGCEWRTVGSLSTKLCLPRGGDRRRWATVGDGRWATVGDGRWATVGDSGDVCVVTEFNN